MDKISIQITINAITSPALLQYLASIQSPKHRSERLRQLAEIGLGTAGTTASGPIAASRQPIVQAALVVPPSPVSEDEPTHLASRTARPATGSAGRRTSSLVDAVSTRRFAGGDRNRGAGGCRLAALCSPPEFRHGPLLLTVASALTFRGIR
ncbi:hypothetical protein [Cupriavidus basilensis]